MLRFILLCAAVMGLVACGANSQNSAPGATRAASNSTAAKESKGTPVVTADGSDTQPTIIFDNQGANAERIDCGDVSIAGNPPRAADKDSAQLAAACFMSTFDACQPAILTFRESDTGMIRQFSVEQNQDKCLVRQALQPDPNSPPAIVECRAVELQDDKFQIQACSHLGDFILRFGN